ncbi:unnamed protein product [Camellia sinensis]
MGNDLVQQANQVQLSCFFSLCTSIFPYLGLMVARHRIKARGADPNSCFVKPAIVPHNEVPNLLESRLFG